jgi:hypothetical protein
VSPFKVVALSLGIAYGFAWVIELVELWHRQRESKMPVAVVTEESQRFDLKTLPDGYVIVRQMTYGERLVRQGFMTKMKLIGDPKKKQGKDDAFGEVEMAVEATALWDLAHLVTQHNLEDASGKPLNLSNANDVRQLRSDIGEEISTYIDKVNSFEDIEEGN